MTPFHAILTLATFLCSLVAGLLFAWNRWNAVRTACASLVSVSLLLVLLRA